MAKREKKLTITTPAASFKFPKLAEPDYGTKEYPKPHGEYNVTLILDEADEETQAFLKALQPAYDEAIAAAEEKFSKLKVAQRKKLGTITQNPLYTEVFDEETEEPTGQIEIKVKTAAGGVYKDGPKKGKKWTRKLPVYDAKGAIMKKVPEIWGGTVGKASISYGPYFIEGTGLSGLTLRLEAVQIIDLVQGGQRAASSYGFGAEDGYEYDEADAASDEDGDDTAADEDEDGNEDEDDGSADF